MTEKMRDRLAAESAKQIHCTQCQKGEVADSDSDLGYAPTLFGGYMNLHSYSYKLVH